MRQAVSFEGGGSVSRARSFRARVGATVAVWALVWSFAACGDDGGSDDDDAANDPPPSTTTTTQPSATDDEEAAFEAVRNLDAEVNELEEWLYEDPSVVEDPDDDNLERFLDLTTDDGATREAVIEDLRDFHERGHRLVAENPGVFDDVVIYNMVSDGPDVIRYKACITQDRTVLDTEGNPVDVEEFPGLHRRIEVSFEVNRIDGMWRSHSNIVERGAEIDSGSGRVGDCERVLELRPELRERMPVDPDEGEAR